MLRSGRTNLLRRRARLALLATALLGACVPRTIVQVSPTYRTAMPLPPDPAAVHALRCRQALGQHQNAEALAECDAAVRARPNIAESYLDRSAAYLGLHMFAAAEADATQAVRLDPYNFGAYNNRGLSFARRGQAAQAIADFNQSLRLNPTHGNALRNRGLAYRALGQNEAALADFNRLLQLRPDWPDAYGGRGTTLARLGRASEGLGDMDMAVRLAPNSPEARNDRGWVREQAGMTEAALTDYAAALALRPSYTLAQANQHRLLATRRPETAQEPEPAPPASPPQQQAEPRVPPVPPAPRIAEPESPPAPVEPPEREPPQALPPSPTGSIITGSGVVLGDGQWAVTNHHVVAGAGAVYLRNGAGYVRRARIVAVSVGDDLALLRTDGVFPGMPAVPLAALTAPEPGRSVVVFGFPRVDVYGSARPTVVTGMVAKAEGLRDDPATFQTTARIRPGNSGGPVFDLNARLLGVMSATLLTTEHADVSQDDAAAVSVGVKSGRILNLLHQAVPAAAPVGGAFTAEELYRHLQDCIVLVAAYP